MFRSFPIRAVSSNLSSAVDSVAGGMFAGSCIDGVPSVGRELLERLYSVRTGYGVLSEAAVGKCTNVASSSQYVGCLETPVLRFICGMALACSAASQYAQLSNRYAAAVGSAG